MTDPTPEKIAALAAETAVRQAVDTWQLDALQSALAHLTDAFMRHDHDERQHWARLTHSLDSVTRMPMVLSVIALVVSCVTAVSSCGGPP